MAVVPSTKMADAPKKRKDIPKSVRFEVLKRDKFTCQYCGKQAPDVILHIDHIKPVAKEGTNDIINLITSCGICNLGKSDKLLSDDSTLKKAKNQLDELQERREQLDMMMEWQRGLRTLSDDTTNEICRYWEELAPGFSVNDNGKAKIKQWVRKYSVAEITEAMDIASEQYLKFEGERVTGDSYEFAFGKIPGICRVNQEAKDDPEIKDLYYIRAILRNRLPRNEGYDSVEALKFLKVARSWGIPFDELKAICRRVEWYADFKVDVVAAIKQTATWKRQHN